MTTNQTIGGVPRELIERVTNPFGDVHDKFNAMQELRALLDAEQPAPVSVVLPERSNERDHAGDFTYEAKAWNACLDELKRLNPSL